MIRFASRMLVLAGLALFLVAGPSADSARGAYILQDLIDGTSGTDGNGNIVVNTIAGKLVFSDWGYLFTGNMPNASLVKVNTYVDVHGNAGILIVGGFYDDPFTAGGSDAALLYQVRSHDGRRIIKDNVLSGDPTVFGAGPGQVLVSERVQSADGAVLGEKGIFEIFDGQVRTSKFEDVLWFEPQSHLLIRKDIFAQAFNSQTGAGISIISQTFSVIPEPGSVVMMGLGLSAVAVGVRVRRRGGSGRRPTAA